MDNRTTIFIRKKGKIIPIHVEKKGRVRSAVDVGKTLAEIGGVVGGTIHGAHRGYVGFSRHGMKGLAVGLGGGIPLGVISGAITWGSLGALIGGLFPGNKYVYGKVKNK